MIGRDVPRLVHTADRMIAVGDLENVNMGKTRVFTCAWTASSCRGDARAYSCSNCRYAQSLTRVYGCKPSICFDGLMLSENFILFSFNLNASQKVTMSWLPASFLCDAILLARVSVSVGAPTGDASS